MTSKPLKCLKLDPSLLEKLRKRNISNCKDVLCFSKHELRNLLRISDKICSELVNCVSQACKPSSVSAYELYLKNRVHPTGGFLPTSLSLLDNALHGGLPIGSITELAGPPSVGKTQFSIMLSLLAVLPINMGGLDSKVLYIDTEGAFSARRLAEIGKSRVMDWLVNESTLIQLMQKIFVHDASTTKKLVDIISHVEMEVIRHNVKLIVVDSIASLFRKEYSSDDKISLVNQNIVLMEQAAALKNIAEKFQIVVFVTNQITSKSTSRIGNFDGEEEYDGIESLESSLQRPPKVNRSQHLVVPALGLAWSHCVTTRLVAQFVDITKRQLSIVKSPMARNASVYYAVDKSGIVLTDDATEELEVVGPNQDIRTKSAILKSQTFQFL